MMFQKAVKQNLKARIALAGVAGSGKTFTGLTLASGLGNKIAVIDTENDRASLYADVFEFDKLNLTQHSPQMYTQAIQMAENAGYEVIVIDSLSHAWNGRGGALEMVNARGGRFQDWAQVTPHQNALMDAIINSRCHVIATMRTKTEYSMDKDNRGKTKVTKLGTQAVQRDGVEYEFDIVAQMDMNHNMTITKTRYAALDNRTIPQPKGDLATEILGWLNSGVEPAQAATAEQFQAITGHQPNDDAAKFEHDIAVTNRLNTLFEMALSNEEMQEYLLLLNGYASVLPDDTTIVEWGITNEVFNHEKHGENAITKLLKTLEPLEPNVQELHLCKIHDVMRRFKEKKAEQK